MSDINQELSLLSQNILLQKSFIHVPLIPYTYPKLTHLPEFHNHDEIPLDECDVQFHIFNLFWSFNRHKTLFFHQYMKQEFENRLKYPELINNCRHFLLLDSNQMTNKETYGNYEKFIKDTFFFKNRHEIVGQMGIVIPLFEPSTSNWVTLTLILNNQTKTFKSYLIDSTNQDADGFISDTELKSKYTFDLEMLSDTIFNEYNKVSIEKPVLCSPTDNFNSGIFSAITSAAFVMLFHDFYQNNFQEVSQFSKTIMNSNYRQLDIQNYFKIFRYFCTNREESQNGIQNFENSRGTKRLRELESGESNWQNDLITSDNCKRFKESENNSYNKVKAHDCKNSHLGCLMSQVLEKSLVNNNNSDSNRTKFVEFYDEFTIATTILSLMNPRCSQNDCPEVFLFRYIPWSSEIIESFSSSSESTIPVYGIRIRHFPTPILNFFKDKTTIRSNAEILQQMMLKFLRKAQEKEQQLNNSTTTPTVDDDMDLHNKYINKLKEYENVVKDWDFTDKIVNYMRSSKQGLTRNGRTMYYNKEKNLIFTLPEIPKDSNSSSSSAAAPAAPAKSPRLSCPKYIFCPSQIYDILNGLGDTFKRYSIEKKSNLKYLEGGPYVFLMNHIISHTTLSDGDVKTLYSTTGICPTLKNDLAKKNINSVTIVTGNKK